MAQYYTSVDLSSALSVGAATKDNKVYIAALDAPLIIQTPPVTLASQLHHDSVFAHLSVPDQFHAFLTSVETALLDAVVSRKTEVLGGRAVSDETLRANHKSFLVGESEDHDVPKALKVRVSDALEVFDSSKQAVGIEDACEGCRVRCVLELSRVCFGRAEWGGMWRLTQVQVCSKECLIVDEADGTEPGDREDGEDREDLADAVDDYM